MEQSPLAPQMTGNVLFYKSPEPITPEHHGKLGIKRVRGDTLGYLQRSFIGCVSDVDQREAREVGEAGTE